MQQWQLSTRWSKDVGWKEDLAFEHRSSILLLKSLAGWDLVSSLMICSGHLCYACHTEEDNNLHCGAT